MSVLRSIPNNMRAWLCYEFGDFHKLRLNQLMRTPHIHAPNLLLVQVKAASVNPIDIRMLSGYGASAFEAARTALLSIAKSSSVTPTLNCVDPLEVQGVIKPFPFPLIPGRDFSGTVVNTSPGLKSFQIGDDVTGAIWPFMTGTLADYILVPAQFVAKKPESVSHNEAVSLGYAALTAYTCIAEVACLKNAPPSRCLIMGASGGLGITATQLCVAWGHDVTVTCSDSLVSQMHQLRPSEVIPQSRWRELVALHGPYDVVLDLVNPQPISPADIDFRPLVRWRQISSWPPRLAQYITLHQPLLRLTDSQGPVLGSVNALWNLCKTNANVAVENKRPVLFQWAFFRPSGKNMKALLDSARLGQLRPVIHKVYRFSDQVSLAFEENNGPRGQRWGKTVISWSDDASD